MGKYHWKSISMNQYIAPEQSISSGSDINNGSIALVWGKCWPREYKTRFEILSEGVKLASDSKVYNMQLDGYRIPLYCMERNAFLVAFAECHMKVAEQTKNTDEKNQLLRQAIKLMQDVKKSDARWNYSQVQQDINAAMKAEVDRKREADISQYRAEISRLRKQAQADPEEKILLLIQAKAQCQEALNVADDSQRKQLLTLRSSIVGELKAAKQDKIIALLCEQISELRRQAKAKTDPQQKILLLNEARAKCTKALNSSGHERHGDLQQLQADVDGELKEAQRPENMAKQYVQIGQFSAAEEIYEKLCKGEGKSPSIAMFMGHAKCLIQLAEENNRQRAKTRQLKYAEEQLKKAEALDKRGQNKDLDVMLDEVETKLGQLNFLAYNSTPSQQSGGSLNNSRADSGASAAPAASNAVTFGHHRFNLDHVLGEGSYGTVYKVSYNDGEAAFKRFGFTILNQTNLAQFTEEACLMRQLRHQAIVRFYDMVAVSPYYGIVMELMPDGSLYDVISKSNGKLSEAQQISFATDIAAGLQYLHSKDIIHRDLKSLNVLVNNGRAKLTDFGLAKVKSHSSIHTKREHPVGTVQWMAPELLQGLPKHTKASDMYSYAMIVWELGSGLTPYQDANNQAHAAQLIKDNVKENIDAVTTVKLAHLIKPCWAAKTNRPTASEALEHLQNKCDIRQANSQRRINPAS